MRFHSRSKAVAVVGLACMLLWSAGCSMAPSTPQMPAKKQEPTYAMVDMQKLLEAHPQRSQLRSMEQKLAALDAVDNDKTALLDAAKKEFEAAMKVRQNQDQAALETKQTELRNRLSEERRQFIEALEAEYRPMLFNLDLKLKGLQNSPTEAQSLQQEKTRIEAERQKKLTGKEDELAERFQREMSEYAKELNGKSETYAQKWMDDRMRDLQKPVVSPEREKQRQEIVALSGRIMQDARAAVAKVAEREKIDIVWLKPAVRLPVKDVTELVTQEIAKGK